MDYSNSVTKTARLFFITFFPFLLKTTFSSKGGFFCGYNGLIEKGLKCRKKVVMMKQNEYLRTERRSSEIWKAGLQDIQDFWH